MEDIPPSYDQSTNPSIMDLIAPYLDTPSLHALTLVSRSYNAAFMPHLWGSPASHFVPVTGPTQPGLPQAPRNEASYDDMVYVALTRFKKILRIARLSTRSLVHTLYLPAAASEIYSGPNATWLREILDGLPNLQSLCVSSLPFFDHHTLIAVDRHRLSQPDRGSHRYPVKLLLAAKELNATSIGLSLFLPHLCGLVYLDLSYTTPARDINVLSSLSALSDLQVLKLRGIGLRDLEAEVLANAIGLRVRLLDIAENQLGDMAVRSLLQACFMHPTAAASGDGNYLNGNGTHPSQPNAYARRYFDSWPVGLPPAPDFLSLDILRSADFDKNLLIQLTNPLTGRLAFEDIPHGGITHLYLNDNPGITIESVKSLLEIGRLHVLDAGDISGETAVDKYVRSVKDAGKWNGRSRSITSSGFSNTDSHVTGRRTENEGDDIVDDNVQLPGAEKLIPVLKEKASQNLTYFRIEHAIITKTLDISKSKTLRDSRNVELASDGRQIVELCTPALGTERAEVPGSFHQAVEMSSDPHVFELDATPVVRAELPGDPIHFAISPPVGDSPGNGMPEETLISPIRGEGAYAPEVVDRDPSGVDEENDIVLDATGSGVRRGFISPTSPCSPAITSNQSNDNNITSIASVLDETAQAVSPKPQTFSSSNRQTQIQLLRGSRSSLSLAKLHPSSLPNLRTLILTDIPARVTSITSPILTSIIEFISACATEARIATLEAQTNYSLPPGRAREAAERRHALSLFALRTIVLEVSPVQSASAQRDWKHTHQRLNISKSSTGDHDSEALWAAAENDFSFFGEEGEEHDECGIYDHEPGKYFPSMHLDEKFALVTDDPATPSSNSSFHQHHTSGSSNFNAVQSPSGTMFRSPRELPLGRNRRPSNETRGSSTPDSPSFSSRRSFDRGGGNSAVEVAGSVPPLTSLPPSLSSVTTVGLSPRSARFDQQHHPRQTPRSTPRMGPGPSETEPSALGSRGTEQETTPIDLISELSKWRRERKSEYEAKQQRRRPKQRRWSWDRNDDGAAPSSAAAGKNVTASFEIQTEVEPDVFVPGYWDGEIKVVRNSRPVRSGTVGVGGAGISAGRRARTERTGMVDVYGNYFEKGYLYS